MRTCCGIIVSIRRIFMQTENEQNNVNGAEAMGAMQASQAAQNVQAPQAENIMAQGVPKMGEEKNEKEGGKMSKKQIAGLVVLTLVAIGGVLFGIYGMNSQNEQISELTVRATTAEGKVAQLTTDKVTITDPDGGVVEIEDATTGYQNPVIKSLSSEEKYQVPFYSGSVVESKQRLSIMIDNGEISSCSVQTPVDEYSWSNTECNISGLSGEIYKVVEFGAGQMNIDDQIGFIMTDGTIQYLPLYESIENNNFSIRGTMKLDGYIIDALKITVGSTVSPAGGYRSTVFVMSDGSYVKYDKSMLE